jgi:hypothetical protein
MECAVCRTKEGKLLRCAGCKNRLFCSEKCQRQDWKSHRSLCKSATLVKSDQPSSTTLSWGPPRQILRVPLGAMSVELFAARFQNVSAPVVITGLFDDDGEKRLLEAFANSSSLSEGLAHCPLECRVYGAGHMNKQADWPAKGYVPKVEYLSGTVMANRIADGSARANDAYVASCDVSSSPVGAKMSVLFEKLMKSTGLKITHFGPSVNLWWGPPGHREGLHVDITDGTLIQLVETQKSFSVFQKKKKKTKRED